MTIFSEKNGAFSPSQLHKIIFTSDQSFKVRKVEENLSSKCVNNNVKNGTAGSPRNCPLHNFKWLWYYILNWLKQTFLPAGYPHSVSDDYLAYQIWDTVQAILLLPQQG